MPTGYFGHTNQQVIRAYLREIAWQPSNCDVQRRGIEFCSFNVASHVDNIDLVG